MTDFEIDLSYLPTHKKATDQNKRHYERLAANFVEEIGREKMVYHAGKFYLYDGTHYVEERQLADKLRRHLWKQRIPQNNTVIGNVVPLIHTIALRDLSKFPSMPFYDGDDGPFPKASNVIAYKNGLLDIESYVSGDPRMLPHSPRWVSTVCLPYDFDGSATCPQWLKFLDEVLEGDAERINLLQEWAGYCLAQDISHHKALFMPGVPRAGKGTTQAVLAALVGEPNCTGFTLHALADKFGLSRLCGKMVAFIGEVNLAACRDKYLILEKFNSIVGGDPQPIEEKQMPLVNSVVLPTRFVIACNEMPNFVDPSGALAARMLVIDYNRSCEGREDRQLLSRLLTEIEGINKWALDGYARLKANGRFTETERMKAWINRFRRESSDILGFVQDCLIVQSTHNPGNLTGVQSSTEPLSVGGKVLQEAFQRWAVENGKECNLNWLGRNLRTIMPKVDYDKRKKVYSGIALIPQFTPQGKPLAPIPALECPMSDGEFATKIRAL